MLAFEWKFPVAVAALLVGLFAIFHGHAHGAEMPDAASGVLSTEQASCSPLRCSIAR